jgi:rubredoxin
MSDLEITIETHPSMPKTMTCKICGWVFPPKHASARLITPGTEGEAIALRENWAWGYICPDCLDAGPVGAAERALILVGYFQEKVAEQLELAEQIRNIHPENWATAKELADAEWKGE